MADEAKTRECKKCRIRQNIDQYCLNKWGRNGDCKACIKAKNAAYYAAKKDVIKAKHAVVRTERKAGIRAPVDVGAMQRRQDTPFEERYEERKAEARVYAAARLQNNPTFRVNKNAENRFHRAYQEWGVQFETMVGCTRDHYVEWFEYLWGPEMTWDTYGISWSIDHVQPRSSFDLNDPEQELICNHWTNLRPVTISENSSKNMRVDEEAIRVQAQNVYVFEELL